MKYLVDNFSEKFDQPESKFVQIVSELFNFVF